MSLFSELKRRNVIRVAMAYVVAAWLIIQVVETILPAFGYGDAVIRYIVILLAIAFIPSLVFSWVFEITPEGLKREVDVIREHSITRFTGKKLDRIIMVLLALALGYFAFDKFILDPSRDAELVAETTQQVRSDALVGSYRDKSIAVLPFVNMSPDPEQEYFSDGISEELLNLLAKIPELRVISRSSAFSFKGKTVDIPTIANKLNVAHILEGSVRKDGNQVRITAQLIDARSDTHLWSETYDREFAAIFQIQDDIAASVVDELKLVLLAEPAKAVEVNPEAYALYLQGYHFLRRRGEENLEKSVDAFRKALELEPNYALGWVGLAIAIHTQTTFYFRDLEEGYSAGLEASERALSLDGSLPEAHVTLAKMKLSKEWDWSGALESLRRAERLDPANPFVLYVKAGFVEALGQFDAGIKLRRKLLESDPLNALGHSYLGFTLRRVGRFEEAEEEYRLVHELDPQLWWHHRDMGWTYLLKDQPKLALGEFEQESHSGYSLQGQAMALYSLGRDAESNAKLTALIDDHRDLYAYQIAEVHAWRNEPDQAFYWLKQAREQRSTWMTFSLRALFWTNLEDDPRWDDFLETIGLSAAQRAALEFQMSELEQAVD